MTGGGATVLVVSLFVYILTQRGEVWSISLDSLSRDRMFKSCRCYSLPLGRNKYRKKEYL